MLNNKEKHFLIKLLYFFIIFNVFYNVELYNNKNGYRVSGKSYLGVLLASQEWGDNIYVHSNEDIYDKIKKFIIETSPNDGVAIHE